MELSLEEAARIVQLCESGGLSPREVLLRACGEPDVEPYRFKLEQLVWPRDVRTWEAIERGKPWRLRDKGGQNRAYRHVLQQLLEWNEPEVSDALHRTQGRSRVYFSKEKRELDQPKPIGLGWYACTKLSAKEKTKILYEILCKLDFSHGYARMISRVPSDRSIQIPGLIFEEAG